MEYCLFFAKCYFLITYHGEIEIPSILSLTTGDYNVTGIDAGAFKNCTAVSLPEGLTSIGGQAVGKQPKGLTIIRMSDGSAKKVIVK